MPRRPNIIPSTVLNVCIPLDLRTKLDLHLYSPLEGRVPFGQYSEFFSERIREFFAERATMDLAAMTNNPGNLTISGSPEAINLLKRMLSL